MDRSACSLDRAAGNAFEVVRWPVAPVPSRSFESWGRMFLYTINMVLFKSIDGPAGRRAGWTAGRRAGRTTGRLDGGPVGRRAGRTGRPLASGWTAGRPLAPAGRNLRQI